MSTTSRTRRRGGSLLRSRGAVVSSLLAVLAGGAGTGALLASALDDPTSRTAGAISSIVPQVDPRSLSGPAYAQAVPGTCLTWSVDAADRVTDFTTVDCAEPHRFEVAGRIDLIHVPGFEKGTPLPRRDRLGLVAANRCMPLVERYSDGRRVDPGGRFTGLVIPPSPEGWDKGDHAVLCGVASSELDGRSATSTGLFVDADQHRTWEPGTCLGFTDEGLPGAPVPCSADHSIEIVSQLDVSGIYPEGPVPPEPRAQAEATAQACYQAGVDYLGDPEALRRTTLISTLVHPVGEISWGTGSRTVNCGLMKAQDPGPFAVLRGSARQGVLVDGTTPVAPTTTAIPPPGRMPGQVPGQTGPTPGGDSPLGTDPSATATAEVPVPAQQAPGAIAPGGVGPDQPSPGAP